jgi:rSAM/selenodomain-associated transferase 2
MISSFLSNDGYNKFICMISVIVPLYNEEKILTEHSAQFQELARNTELIFVDGGSEDRSVSLARPLGIVLKSPRGRAAQMNCGAKAAKSDVLLFLHADNQISEKTVESIQAAINAGHVGGCLTQTIDNEFFVYRLIEAEGNARARRSKVFYGDQGIFVRRNVFEEIGGYPEVPILEDVFFTKKLRKQGTTVVLPDSILVSARRWEKHGILRATVIFNLITILSWFKVPLSTLKNLYEDLR